MLYTAWVGTDVSVSIVPAIASKTASDQQLARPQVPVTAPAEAVLDVCESLQEADFEPILVFDGASNPLKHETNAKRYRHLPEDEALLEQMCDKPAQPVMAEKEEDNIKFRQGKSKIIKGKNRKIEKEMIYSEKTDVVNLFNPCLPKFFCKSLQFFFESQ